jgi:palmitoyltransferase
MELSQLFVPCVYALIFFLGYPSQWLLTHLDPAPLNKNELIFANIIVVVIFLTYTQSVFVDPGTIPKDWTEKELSSVNHEKRNDSEQEAVLKARKWCRKCSAPKPPRAHHCKSCRRCIPKMDHHCPWTANCVSHTTFPHFIRFLLYTSIGLSFLEYLLFTRLHHLWTNRDLPSYLGPSTFLLAHLFTTLVVNSFTLFALGILCVNNIWALLINTTTIEGWEIQRHRTLIRRARHFGGYLETPEGNQVRIKKQEFPYDIGVWGNVVQGMGSANPILWFLPLAPSPKVATGMSFQTNGFEDEGTVWPPPDPDRAFRRPAKAVNGNAFVYGTSELSERDALEAFKARQKEDAVRKRRPFIERLEEKQKADQVHRGEDEGYEYGDDASDAEEETDKHGDGEGEEGWRNSEGERLQDFGVDEDVEFYDEQDDEIPLAELMARRRQAAMATPARS